MIKGVLAVLAASVAYGVMPVFSKTAMAQGMNAESVVFFRFLFSAVFALLFLIRRSNRRYVTHQQLRHLLIFGILGFGMTINLLTFSYQYIPTGLATMFHFAYPLVILAVMAVLYHEKITRYKVAAVAVALAGVALLADFSQGLALPGVLLALGSAVTYAAFVIAGRKSSFAILPPMEVIFFVSAFSTLIFGAKSLLLGQLQAPPNGTAFVCLIIISVVCTIFALAMLTYGIRTLGASTASVLNMLEPVVSVVAGVLAFAEPLNIRTMAGCAAIIAASILIVLGERSAQRAASRQ